MTKDEKCDFLAGKGWKRGPGGRWTLGDHQHVPLENAFTIACTPTSTGNALADYVEAEIKRAKRDTSEFWERFGA